MNMDAYVGPNRILVRAFFPSKPLQRHSLLGLAVCAVCIQATAAPLDTLLTATPNLYEDSGRVEVAFDAMNSTLDVFKIREKDPNYSGTNVGDYSGAHILASYGLSDRLWLDLGLWQRKISYRSDTESVHSWQTAVQYRFPSKPNASLGYGLRLSAWGNKSGALEKSTPTNAFGQTLDNIRVEDPQDRQVQLDFLSTWRPLGAWSVSAFAGAGISTVDVGAVQAGYNGCQYAIRFKDNAVTGTQIGTCGALLSSSFSVAVSGNLADGIAYNADYLHAGVNLRWQSPRWTVRGGYSIQQVKRDQVDDLARAQSMKVYERNQIIEGELALALDKGIETFVRGELMTNQFLGEIPFAYNTFTTSKFGGKYGLVSIGLRGTM